MPRRSLELAESRVTRLERDGGDLLVVCSHVYVRQSAGRGAAGSGWSQSVAIVLREALLLEQPGRLPCQVRDGWLECRGVRHELLELPFRRRGEATLVLDFDDGSRLRAQGRLPAVEPLGAPIFLEALD